MAMITGQKIYITWGDHDVAENIIHLVLARLPDAPEGSKGISLFLCPKMFVKEDGSLGERNAFKPIGLVVGEENRGLSCMFTMMNEARLFVGVQGVAIGERAYQAALDYANERVQGRTIISSVGVQIHGGMGFVEETGAAQHYRDSRIAPIYEGTNGIQAMDLVGRKLRRDGGEGMKALIADLDSILALAEASSLELSVCTHALKKGIETVKTATDIMLNADEGDALSGEISCAVDYAIS